MASASRSTTVFSRVGRATLGVLLISAAALPVVAGSAGAEPGSTSSPRAGVPVAQPIAFTGESVTLPPVEVEAVPGSGSTVVAEPAGFVPGGASAGGASTSVLADPFTFTYNGAPAQIQTAVDYTADIWASQLRITVPITVSVTWTDLPGNVLGSASASVYNGLSGGPIPAPGAYFPAALANQLVGHQIDPAGVDIIVNIDSGSPWYVGTDGAVPAGSYDLVSVMLHELGHALGVAGSLTAPSGGSSAVGSGGYPFIYDRFVETGAGTDIWGGFPTPSAGLGAAAVSNDLWWNSPAVLAANGGRARIYAPNPWQSGSSYSHVDESTYPQGNLNSLMTPAIASQEVIHSPGPIAVAMLQDELWTPTSVPGAPTGASAIPGNGSAAVSWTPPVDDGGLALLDYTATASTGQTCTTSTNGCTVTGLTNGASTTFTVRARNSKGLGVASAASSAVVPRTIPGAPTAVSATAGNGQATLLWTAPASDGGAAVNGYVVTPYVGAAAQSAQTFDSTATSQTVTGLVNGTAYTFKVAAKNSAGTGAQSGASNAVTPTLTIQPGAGSVVEGNAGDVVVNIPVTLSNASSQTVTVDYNTLNLASQGFAAAGVDFVATTGTVTFTPGQTTKTVPVTVHGDTVHETPAYLGEWIALAFTNPSVNAHVDLSFYGLGVGIIADDDPIPTIRPQAAGVTEGNSGDVTVNVPVVLSNASDQPITVDYHTLDTGAAGIATAGADYVAKTGTVTFAPGETTKTVAITVHGDLLHETPLLYGEWILVAFSNPSATAVLDTSFYGLGIGVIIDDD